MLRCCTSEIFKIKKLLLCLYQNKTLVILVENPKFFLFILPRSWKIWKRFQFFPLFVSTKIRQKSRKLIGNTNKIPNTRVLFRKEKALLIWIRSFIRQLYVPLFINCVNGKNSNLCKFDSWKYWMVCYKILKPGYFIALSKDVKLRWK